MTTQQTDRQIAAGLMEIKMLQMFLNSPRRLGMTDQEQKNVVAKIENVINDPNAQNTLDKIEQEVKEKRAAKIE